MYNNVVADEPDLILSPSVDEHKDDLRRRIIFSVVNVINAPETLPYIRCAVVSHNWERIVSFGRLIPS